MPHFAVAGDTDRLADCVAMADMAGAAAKSRDAGVSPTKTITIITSRQMPDELKSQVNEVVTDVYSDRLTPDQVSEKVLENCFELESD